MSKNKDSIMIPKNYLVVGLIVIIAITGGIFIGSKITGKSIADTDQSNNLQNVESNSISNQQIKEKQTCPFECCLGDSNYNDKSCGSNDHQCINNKCVAVDSDKDGLTDIEERAFGSNPFVYDTDSDGLSDYVEKQKGTNPNNPNTDGDRYNDNEDPDPSNKNSADIKMESVLQKVELNYINIGILIATGGLSALNPNLELYSTEADIRITNIGNDYTAYLDYEIILSIGDSELNKKSFSYKRVDAGANVVQHISFSTTVGDVPDLLLNLITTQTKPQIKIMNINYERF